MKEFQNNKGFLILEVSRQEMLDKLGQYGCLGICDFCGKPTDKGLYVAVINQWMCPDCFFEWYIRAERYKEDIPTEERNYEFYKKTFSDEKKD